MKTFLSTVTVVNFIIVLKLIVDNVSFVYVFSRKTVYDRLHLFSALLRYKKVNVCIVTETLT